MTSRWGKMETATDFIFLGSKSLQKVTVAMKLKKILTPWRKRYDKPRQHIIKQRCHFADKGPYSQSYVFFFPVFMYRCESWTTKKTEHWRIDASDPWCWRRHLRIPWTPEEPVNPKGNPLWIFTERTDAEAKAPVHWPPDVKSWLTGKDSDAGNDWDQEEKGATEVEMVGWQHRLNGHWIWANSGW